MDENPKYRPKKGKRQEKIMEYQRNILRVIIMLTALLLCGCGKRVDDKQDISFKDMVESQMEGERDAVQNVPGDEEDMQSTENQGVQNTKDLAAYQEDDSQKADETLLGVENVDSVLANEGTDTLASGDVDILQATFRWETGENEDSKGAELMLWVNEDDETVGIEGSSWAGINVGEFKGLAVTGYEDGTLEFVDENGNTLLVFPLEDGGIYVEESGITGGMGTTFSGVYQAIP